MVLFQSTVYVKIYVNKMWVKHIESGNAKIESSTEPFTTKRLLVGQFGPAEKLLTQLIKATACPNWFSPSPIVLIHPTAMIEGGLSQIEDRALRELGAGSGARSVHIWIGHELSDNEVLQKLHQP